MLFFSFLAVKYKITGQNPLIKQRSGMDEMIKRTKPYAISVYGGEVEYDYKDIPVSVSYTHLTLPTNSLV